MIDKANVQGYKLITTAFMGSAAAIMNGGRTIHSLFNIPITFSDVLTPMTPESLARARLRFRNAIGVVVDEISMCPSAIVNAIDERCRTIVGVNEPFGGLAVYFLGDFFQLPPISSFPIYKSVLQQFTTQNIGGSRISAATTTGNILFSHFHMTSLTQQMRAAEDLQHTSILEDLRNLELENPITSRTVIYLLNHTLTASDIQTDPQWAITPIIVTSNPERYLFYINF
jgi:hypothetical protein